MEFDEIKVKELFAKLFINVDKLSKKDKTSILEGKSVFPLEYIDETGQTKVGSIKVYKENEKIKLNIIEKKDTLEIKDVYFGVKVSASEKQQLIETGYISLNTVKGNMIGSIDPKLNRILFLNTDCVQIPSKIKGINLTEEDKLKLKQGKEIKKIVKNKNMFLRVSASHGGVLLVTTQKQKNIYLNSIKDVVSKAKITSNSNIESKIVSNTKKKESTEHLIRTRTTKIILENNQNKNNNNKLKI